MTEPLSIQFTKFDLEKFKLGCNNSDVKDMCIKLLNGMQVTHTELHDILMKSVALPTFYF